MSIQKEIISMHSQSKFSLDIFIQDAKRRKAVFFQTLLVFCVCICHLCPLHGREHLAHGSDINLFLSPASAAARGRHIQWGRHIQHPPLPTAMEASGRRGAFGATSHPSVWMMIKVKGLGERASPALPASALTAPLRDHSYLVHVPTFRQTDWAE